MVGFKTEKGFTMIETILVIVILGILAVVIGAPLIQGSLAWQEVSTRKDATQFVRLGMDRMVRELRNTQRLANNTPNVAEVTTGPATCIRFTDALGNLILYKLNGTSLDRATGGTCASPTTANSLASNVTSFTITCYSNTNAVISPCSGNLSGIRRLLLQLVATVGVEAVELDSQVTFRDLLGF
jgi:prepilin-type N-terminal cleavage/methylation domain-containing protein